MMAIGGVRDCELTRADRKEYADHRESNIAKRLLAKVSTFEP